MFTDFEYSLMLTVAVLLWRNADVKRWAEREERRANRYADFLVQVGSGKGSVIKTDEGKFEFREKV